jgi:hypothetical protein
MRFILILGVAFVAILNSWSAFSAPPEESQILHFGVIAVAKTSDFLGDEFKANQTALMQYLEFLNQELNFKIENTKYTVEWDVKYIDGLKSADHYSLKSSTPDQLNKTQEQSCQEATKGCQQADAACQKADQSRKIRDEQSKDLNQACKELDSSCQNLDKVCKTKIQQKFDTNAYSCENINKSIENMEKKDVILFYYSGHGQAARLSESPRISCADSQFEAASSLSDNEYHEGKEITIDDVMDKLRRKARLTIVIADTCNNIANILPEIKNLPQIELQMEQAQEFMTATQLMYHDYRGQIIMWSAKREECSVYRYHNKGYFTDQIMSAFNNAQHSVFPDTIWKEFVADATKPITLSHNQEKLFKKNSCYRDVQYPVSADEVKGVELCAPTRGQCPLRIAKDRQTYGYVSREAIWTFPKDKEKIISVCWENPSPAYKEKMDWVRDGIRASWEEASALTFKGWENACTPSSAGIRIKIGDENSRNKSDFEPHINNIGQTPAGPIYEMVLNLDFKKWSSSCPDQPGYDLKTCIQSVAVHEFGHALGFVHKLNRPDTPGECNLEHREAYRDLLLTPYDPQSVMNYCNPKYENKGKLSWKNTIAVQELYCPKGNPSCEPKVTEKTEDPQE